MQLCNASRLYDRVLMHDAGAKFAMCPALVPHCCRLHEITCWVNVQACVMLTRVMKEQYDNPIPSLSEALSKAISPEMDPANDTVQQCLDDGPPLLHRGGH